jgi:methionine--tRNA ligase beta chain
MINIDDLHKCEIKIGKILSAERIEGSDKLLKLMVDLNESAPRQILSGVAKAVSDPQELVGKEVPFVTNLEPRMMMGLESQGMMLAANDGAAVFLHPSREVPPGSSVV